MSNPEQVTIENILLKLRTAGQIINVQPEPKAQRCMTRPEKS
jgi:hypothetical protein